MAYQCAFIPHLPGPIDTGGALKTNITTLGCLFLPVSEKLLCFSSVVGRKVFNMNMKPYILDFKLSFYFFLFMLEEEKWSMSFRRTFISSQYMYRLRGWLYISLETRLEAQCVMCVCKKEIRFGRFHLEVDSSEKMLFGNHFEQWNRRLIVLGLISLIDYTMRNQRNELKL